MKCDAAEKGADNEEQAEEEIPIPTFGEALASFEAV
jgi:hypothetical protein